MPKRVDKYDKERMDILQKMFNILDINENNNTFLLHELDNNDEKQKQILELEPEIKRYFICSSWSCFKDPNIKRKYLSLIKHMLKYMNYNIYSVRKFFKTENDISYRDTVYNIIIN